MSRLDIKGDMALLEIGEIINNYGMDFARAVQGEKEPDIFAVTKKVNKITLEYVIDKIEKANTHRCKRGDCKEIEILDYEWQSLKEELLNE